MRIKENKMTPFNRHLLVTPIEDKEEKEQSTVLVPEGYKSKPRHGRVKVLEKAEDCKIPVSVGDILIVNSSMIEEVTVSTATYSLILENHILGRVKE
jgi:co-chaperonin GroES (HSP10)